MNGTYSGVVDRIEDGETAVILLEDDDGIVDQLDLPIEQVPDSARSDGSVVSIELEDSTVVSIDYDASETQSRGESVREKLDRLSERLSEK
ncbi:DUF3006 domain-containing protein [Natronosalvus vescus]|uniref:DUF3006 domain-containing protein n=1 Tax=Natronosalvus vescus TaxID=2953881 RepID=UPI0020905259|nr:DUF3006 domain-containing protein [Natronosalvus vescus]